jgi:putative transposase
VRPTVPPPWRPHCKENTRRLQRLVTKGRAQVLSMTLSEQGGRLYIAVQAIVAQQPRTPSQPDGRCGVDLGIGREWAVIAHDRLGRGTPSGGTSQRAATNAH